MFHYTYALRNVVHMYLYAEFHAYYVYIVSKKKKIYNFSLIFRFHLAMKVSCLNKLEFFFGRNVVSSLIIHQLQRVSENLECFRNLKATGSLKFHRFSFKKKIKRLSLLLDLLIEIVFLSLFHKFSYKESVCVTIN